MFAQSIDFDQQNRLEQDQIIEEIYLEGIGYGFDCRLPVMAEIIYLKGYCEGMKQLKKVDSLIAFAPQEEQTELPLVCGQCTYFNNGKCAIKGVARNGNSYACERIKVDCPF